MVTCFMRHVHYEKTFLKSEPETVKEQTNVLKMGTLHTEQYWIQLLNDMRNYADLTG